MDAGQEHHIPTFDQQLYAIAQQVKWWRRDIFDPHILRLCDLHSLSTVIPVLGKMWADRGLHDLLVDSGVYAGNTVEQMLTGKLFNRTVRGFTFVFYSLNIIYIVAFIHWCRIFDHFEEIHDVFWNCLFDFHTNFGEIFTWSGNCHDFNKLRVKVATIRDSSLVRLSPLWSSIVVEHSFRSKSGLPHMLQNPIFHQY